MRAGIIGLGPMGRRHVAALERVEGVSLVAVCDTNAKALEWGSLPSSVARFKEADAMFGSQGLDLVVVATNAPGHRPLVEMAVGARASAILCEKPIATSLRSAREMINLCARSGVALAVNHCRRHVPAYQWLASRIASGDWGVLRGVRIGVPGIGLGCLGTHFLDLMRMLSGDDFFAATGWIDEERGANPRGPQFRDPGGLIVLTGNRGSRFVLHQVEDGSGPASIVLDLTAARVVVEESARDVHVIWRDRAVVPGPGRPPRFESVTVPKESPLDLDIVSLTAEVVRELANGGSLTCAAEHGYASLEPVVAAYLSQERGSVPVTLPLIGDEETGKELAIT